MDLRFKGLRIGWSGSVFHCIPWHTAGTKTMLPPATIYGALYTWPAAMHITAESDIKPGDVESGFSAIPGGWRDGAGLSATQLLTRGIEYWAEPEQINVASHYLWENDSTYKGNLLFCQKWISYSGPQQPGNASEPFKMSTK
jgi:hypothetical protein